ncbi:hypothetical protein Sjap_015195 [Stephania japonica]|uniref:Uncharacterized protein n=1 Tax=Stephania japonica TaxID=461633 RepID=A0AAP0IIS6_9MAGN
MARGKTRVTRVETDSNPSRADLASNAKSCKVVVKGSCGGRKPQTASYRKAKKNVQPPVKHAQRRTGDDVVGTVHPKLSRLRKGS